MPTVTLCLNNQGKLDGVTEKDGKAYGKFLSRHGGANAGQA